MLDQKIDYEDLGPNHFETIDPGGRARYHKKQLEKLGHQVRLEEKEMAA